LQVGVVQGVGEQEEEGPEEVGVEEAVQQHLAEE
jgi:hypothetical protein